MASVLTFDLRWIQKSKSSSKPEMIWATYREANKNRIRSKLMSSFACNRHCCWIKKVGDTNGNGSGYQSDIRSSAASSDKKGRIRRKGCTSWSHPLLAAARVSHTLRWKEIRSLLNISINYHASYTGKPLDNAFYLLQKLYGFIKFRKLGKFLILQLSTFIN